MPKCPICTLPMERRELVQRRSYYNCFGHGAWVQLAFFRWFKGAEHIAVDLRLERAHILRRENRELTCPTCRIPLRVTAAKSGSKLEVDQCFRCDGVWFDSGELERLENGGELAEQFPPVERKSRPRPRPALEVDDVIHPLQFLGLPVEEDRSGVSRFPAATFMLILFSVATTIRASKSHAFLMDHLFYPADPFRHLGLNALVSIFMHGDWWHLLGNMYFLFLVGDNIEEDDGPGGLLALFFSAAMAGHLASMALESGRPSLGASGGVAGLLVYYALSFPHNRFNLLISGHRHAFGVFNLSVTAPFFVAGWMAMQFCGLAWQLAGVGHVNFIAHLGGAATGIFLYILRKPKP